MKFFVLGILFVIAIKALFVFFTSICVPATGGAIFTRTHPSMIKKILENIKLEPNQVVYDLGCGDGRFLREVAKRYNVRAIGFEINPWAYFLARIYNLFSRAKVKVVFANFWKKKVCDANLIFCYLFPDVMRKLEKKLERELKPGTLVVSCNFPLPDWRPEKIIRAAFPYNDPIYIYQFRP